MALVQYEALHVVAQWTGHTVETMRKFYLQVTKEHRQNAKRREKEAKAKQSVAEAKSSENDLNPRTDRGSKAKQKAKQSESERASQSESAENAEGRFVYKKLALSRFVSGGE